MILALMLLLMLASAGTAVWLFVYANRRERTEDVLQRLHAGEEAAVTVVSDTLAVNPFLRSVCHLFWRAGSDVKPRQLLIGMAIAAALSLLILLVLGWFNGLFALAAIALIITIVLNHRIARRRGRIVEQLPSFLEAVMRVLAAGNTLEESLASAARESADPLRSLFVSVSRQVRLGAAVEVVLADAAEIHKIGDLRVLALAANINRKYGGTLRNVFRSLIQAIRMREAAARELRALTAETRFSAVVLAAIPMLVSAFIYFRNRAFYDDMLATDSGRATLMIAVALQVVGVFIIWRMMRSTQEGSA